MPKTAVLFCYFHI
jgi:hypothetical protein